MTSILQAQAIALLAAAAVCGGAVAQELEDVTVQASQIVKVHTGKSWSGIPVYTVSVTHAVPAADLDLSTSEGMVILEDRVEEAAQHGCREIGMAHPDAAPDNQACTRRAVSETMAQVRELLAKG